SSNFAGPHLKLRSFPTRRSSDLKAGFDLAELPEAIRILHGRGVRGYVTFNTLIFEHELTEAARVIAAIAEAGADGMIEDERVEGDRKSTRLNSSHGSISYAVFCL